MLRALSAEGLMFLFRHHPAEVNAPAPATFPAAPFDLAGFPLLPLGNRLFSDDAGNIEGLDGAVSHLPDCLVVLTTAGARGAVLVAGGTVVDAVWVDDSAWLVGVDAARAVFGAREGNVAAHSIDDPRLVAAMPILWQAPRLCAAVPGSSAAAIRAARPGVDDFVATIQAIASMDIPRHENAVIHAMAREMHFRAAEVLCGV